MSENALQEVSVEEILHHYNLIVPEIQREYVWGYNAHNIIDVFINDVIEGRSTKDSKIQSESENLQNLIDSPSLPEETKTTLRAALQQMNDASLAMNIGFLYSYRPGYGSASKDRDLYLIDGQQRFTTIFLLLFYFAIKENRERDFVNLFNINISKGSLGFDYRVRNLTHHFFVELFSHTQTIEDLLDVRNKTWFLNNFSLDVTIRSIVGDEDRYSIFQKFDEKFKSSTDKYFDYIKSKIKFWHFKTEETSQGEELYITMNSRGQQLADNESIRAKLFDSDIVRNNPLVWSEKWEKWQDFFWKNRLKIRGFSADEGFNEFLRWSQLLKMIEFQSLNNDDVFEKKIHYLQSNKKDLDTTYLELNELSSYFESLAYIKNFFTKNHLIDVLKPFDKFKIEFNFSEFINGSFLNQNQLFILLPLLAYCKKHIESNIPIDDFGFLRVFQFVSNLSNDSNVKKSVRDLISNMVQHINMLEIGEDVTALLVKKDISKTILNEEQRTKLIIYNNYADNRLRIEDAFWFCTMLKYNDGEILHLIKLSLEIESDFNIEVFENIVEAYSLYLKYEHILKGELIPTNAYFRDNDKVIRKSDFYKQSGFLELIKKLYQFSNPDMDSFIQINQKNWFIDRYENESALLDELNAQNQLYIIYILKYNQVLGMSKHFWENGRFNFGVWSSYGNCKTIFNNKVIYQLIKSKFVANSEYIFDFHSKKTNLKDVFAALENWSKN
ncbi:hypothetical protein RT99_09865 [Flavobacterium sp. MEB061]|uniref:GmrSD restriction endonuclease domain-containing protein n=1 Tax=Flavobacterium sp. MEB061 TaxID=1587524 RepID=UPI0005ACBA1B|nr:DUF262 domain-containing protein [Flavobacterium sp. MEB061]KIQ22465.1 hypothetical protein RT99_09865 [Flavobacterium sp. MEB061]